MLQVDGTGNKGGIALLARPASVQAACADARTGTRSERVQPPRRAVRMRDCLVMPRGMVVQIRSLECRPKL
eukprot:5669536-Alexandrium_andersonii.AAC.1